MLAFELARTKSRALQILLCLLAIELFMLVAYLMKVEDLSESLGLLLDLDGEGTFPAWFSSMQLFVIGLAFMGSGSWSRRASLVWPSLLYLVGAGFVFLSMDEGASIHEKITPILRDVPWIPHFKDGHGVWITVYLVIIVLCAAIGLRTARSFLRVYRREGITMVVGLGVFLLGAVGLEVISYEFLRSPETEDLYRIEVGFEEFLEMLGATLILFGAMSCGIPEGTPASEPV